MASSPGQPLLDNRWAHGRGCYSWEPLYGRYGFVIIVLLAVMCGVHDFTQSAV